MSNVNRDGWVKRVREFEDFIDLTSDKNTREAAYPQTEWVENKGNTATGFLAGLNSYSSVSLQDAPPRYNSNR